MMKTLRIIERDGIKHGALMPGYYNVEIRLDEQLKSATSNFTFEFPPAAQEHLRWYMEDLLLSHYPARDQLAKQAEHLMTLMGVRLFNHLFVEESAAREIWDAFKDELETTRIEVWAEQSASESLPWELLKQTDLSTPLALGAGEFCRVYDAQTETVSSTDNVRTPFRILLAISRPLGRTDVPFRMVAGPVIDLLLADGRVDLQVLRPATFERLTEVLGTSFENGRPFDFLHFDGHGIYESGQGYLLFENPAAATNTSRIPGKVLGKILTRYGVRALVMNACRSGFAKAIPEVSVEAGHIRVRAYNSLAYEAIAAGVEGVVALRYSVTPGSALSFLTGFYRAFLEGATLGQAATAGRRNLDYIPARWCVRSLPRTIDDWYLPIVYERTGRPVSLPKTESQSRLLPTEPLVPSPPDPGFYGRDSVLLELDRAFDGNCAVFLTGEPGSGKTATAAEFARWYARSGGSGGPIRWSSAADVNIDLPAEWARLGGLRIIDDFENSTISNAQLETIIASLANGSKLLLVGERLPDGYVTERLPVITMDVFRPEDAIDCVRAIIDRLQLKEPHTEILEQLADFAQGNALALQIAARETFVQLEPQEFLLELQTGQAEFSSSFPQADRLRDRAEFLFNSLSSERDRAVVAALHVFRAFVSTEVLSAMGHPEADWCLDALRDITEAEAANVLDLIVPTGLISDLQPGLYRLHPLAPWALKPLFERFYAEESSTHKQSRQQLLRAFAESVGGVNQQYRNQLGLGMLHAESRNLNRARRVALNHGWWRALMWCMLALETFCKAFGMQQQWGGLVAEVVPLLVDDTDYSIPGRERYYGLIMSYRVELLKDTGQTSEAERLQNLILDWARAQASPFLSAEPHVWHSSPYELFSLADAYHTLGKLRLELNLATSIPPLIVALKMFRRMQDANNVASISYNLGSLRRKIANINLMKAERWYKRAFRYYQGVEDYVWAANCLVELGGIDFERGQSMLSIKQPSAIEHLQKARQKYRAALERLSENEYRALSTVNHQLALVESKLGEFEVAVRHYRDAILNGLRGGDAAGAAVSQMELARYLLLHDDVSGALHNATAAKSTFDACGDLGASQLPEVEQLLDEVYKRL